MAESESPETDTFWRFAIDRYGRGGVSERCLDLQDRVGADVCVALFCLWKGQERVSVSAETLGLIEEGDIGRWHRDVVKPLRQARRAMKVPPAALDGESVELQRNRIKLAELAAEKQEIMLLALVDKAGVGNGETDDLRSLAVDNLKTYLAGLGQADERLAEELASVLGRLCID